MNIRYCLAVFCILALSLGPTVVAQDQPIMPIDTKTSDPTDAEIEARLSEIFQQIEGLQEVSVESKAGVVTLGGTVLRDALAADAERLTGAVNGVVIVQNEIHRDTRIVQQVEPVIKKLTDFGSNLLLSLPILLLAAVVVVLFWWLGGWISRIVHIPKAWAPNLFVGDLVRLFVRLAVGLIGFLLAAEILGATALLVSVMGGLGVVGLAFGFAIRDTVENFVASVLLSLRQPFGANAAVTIRFYSPPTTLERFHC